MTGYPPLQEQKNKSLIKARHINSDAEEKRQIQQRVELTVTQALV
jgi:hypothetical protein